MKSLPEPLYMTQQGAAYVGDACKLPLTEVRGSLPRKRPSGHAISCRFAGDRGGAIPPNLLQLPNTESNSSYLRACQMVGAGGHPSRFPKKLPEFFIHFLTDEGDTVLDLFAGSNTTDAVAETLGRRWLAFEIEQSYLACSAFRFLDVSDEATVCAVYHQLMDKGARGLRLPPGTIQGCLFENDGRKKGFREGMASGSVANFERQALAANKLLPRSDLCFRVGRKTAGEEWFSGAARRYGGKILEIRHISSCGHGS